MATKKKTNTAKKQGLSSGQPRSYGELYKSDKASPTPIVATTTKKVTVVKELNSSGKILNWRQEYMYVARDLRMLGIVSAVLFGIILISGFFF